MKKLTLLFALSSVITVAMADEPIVIKDTRSGISINGAPSTGILLVRLGQKCSLTEYKWTTDKVAMPVVDQRDYLCDTTGAPVEFRTDSANANSDK